MPKRSTSPTESARAAAADAETLWPPGFAAWIKAGLFYQKGSRYLAGLLKPLDLTVAQFDALANLYLGDGITQQELAERLLVTKGNVTGLINRLSERSLVERRLHPQDRRANTVYLTAQGRTLAKAALEVQRLVIDETMSVLSLSDKEKLRALLTRMVAQVDDLLDRA
jgi:DNA-binding MarR family transcriptional regulator